MVPDLKRVCGRRVDERQNWFDVGIKWKVNEGDKK